MTAKQKDEVIRQFQDNPRHKIYIGQIKASGEGVDGLQNVCSHGIFAELDWSEGGMRQVKARLHRIGQKKQVHFTFLIADNTMENVIF